MIWAQRYVAPHSMKGCLHMGRGAGVQFVARKDWSAGP